MPVGPQRNVLKDLKDAFNAKDPEFHFGIYYSLFEWFNPLYLKDKNTNFQTRSVIESHAQYAKYFDITCLEVIFSRIEDILA